MSLDPSHAVPTPERPPDYRGLLRKHGIRPNKRLGQHFLFEAAALERVVAAAELQGDETVLEIGAGVGSLTHRLAQAARRVLAVEVDGRLIPALQEAVASCANVEIIPGDILDLDLGALLREQSYQVVANIPYQITSILIRRLLEAPRPAQRLVLTIQREVAERVVAGVGEMSLLALSVQLYGEPRLAGSILAGAFFPPPNVDSSILRVDIHPEPRLPRELIPPFFRIARAGFGQKRKQLRNALAGGLGLEPRAVAEWLVRAGLSPQSRAQELELEDWERLVRSAGEIKGEAGGRPEKGGGAS